MSNISIFAIKKVSLEIVVAAPKEEISLVNKYILI